jgi:hypothetical protein
MKCVSCASEQNIKEFDFFYGNKTGQNTEYLNNNPNTTRTTTYYSVGGPAQAWVCNKCIIKRKVTRIIYSILLLLAVITIFGLGGLSAWPLAVIPSLILAYILFNSFIEVGENIAIDAKRKEYNNAGFVYLWTPNERNRLKSI